MQGQQYLTFEGVEDELLQKLQIGAAIAVRIGVGVVCVVCWG